MDTEDKYRKLEARVCALERALISSELPNTRTQKTQSIREFINDLKPKSQNDHILVIGYFFEQNMDKGYFTNEDLKSGYVQAKIIGPKNLSDAISQNAKKGYIMEHASKSGQVKAWVLTNTGEGIISEMQKKDD